MKSASIQELKQELATLKPKDLMELCLRLGRFKKENKELLTFLLFEAHDEAAYIQSLKQDIEAEFSTINLSHLYFVKKSLRKILRLISRHVRYTGSKTAEVEWLIYFCTLIKESGIPYEKSLVLGNLYNNQLKKVEAAVEMLHEDLQYEYQRGIARLK
jgi:hypothetical protein